MCDHGATMMTTLREEARRVRLQWIPFLMFIFFVSKNTVARSFDSLQIFRIALLWSHLFPTVYFFQRIVGILSTRLSFPRFQVGWLEWKMSKKSKCKGKKDPVEDCC